METEKRVTWAILIILSIFAIGFFIFAAMTRIGQIRQQYEIKLIQQQIDSIEKVLLGEDSLLNKDADKNKDEDNNMDMEEKEDVDEDEDNFEEISLYDCEDYITKEPMPVDDDVLDMINDTNENFADYIDNGYKLKFVCNSNDMILYFMDFETGYFDAEKPDEDLAKQAVVGVSDENDFFDIDFYDVEINDYRFEGTGLFYCMFDNYDDDYESVQYTCNNSSDDGVGKYWYSLDLEKDENILVKETFDGSATSLYDKEEINYEDLLDLFTR